MSLHETLKPGPHADDKPPVGMNMGPLYTAVAEIPPEVRDAAMRAVASRARDAADARGLLEHLGLIEPRVPNPQWRRANKPKAAS